MSISSVYGMSRLHRGTREGKGVERGWVRMEFSAVLTVPPVSRDNKSTLIRDYQYGTFGDQ